MEDLIRRSDAIANIEILLDDISDVQDEDELKELKTYNLGVRASLNSIKHHVPSADRWIPCEERMPEEPFDCLVTVEDSYFNGSGFTDCESILPYFVGWDGEQWNDCNGGRCPFEVLAWMPLPKPYKGEDDGEDIQSADE